MPLKPCPNCHKDISDLAENCPKCGILLKPGCTQPNQVPPQSQYDSATQVKEIRRTCKECGKVWHSLSEHEDELKKKAMMHACADCNPCVAVWSEGCAVKMCSEVNGVPNSVGGIAKVIENLKKCPSCSSGNYAEEVIIYERKK